MNSKAQFYIVAAILIVVIISGIASLTTYALVKPQPKAIEEISSELKEEGYRVLEYGVYNGNNLDDLLTKFTAGEYAPYFLEKTHNANIVFLYGDKTYLNAVQYSAVSTGTISVTGIGGVAPAWNPVGTFAQKANVVVVGNKIIVKMDLDDTLPGGENDYEFKINNNEVFYFLIIQERDGEVYIEKN